MTTSRLLRGALVALVLFVVSDFVWHGWLLMDFYSQKVAAVGGSIPTGFTTPITVFYIVSSLGVSYFVQASHPKDWMGGLWRGAVLCLLMIGSLNLINNMLLPAWDWTLVGVDVAWGVVTGAITGAAVVAATRKAA